MGEHTCNPGTQENEIGESLHVQGQPEPQGESTPAWTTQQDPLSKKDNKKLDSQTLKAPK